MGHQFVLEFDFQVAEVTRNTSEKAEEKAEAGSKDDSKEMKADENKSDSAPPADKKAFLVTEKFLVDVLGVRCNVSIKTEAFSKISASSLF